MALLDDEMMEQDTKKEVTKSRSRKKLENIELPSEPVKEAPDSPVETADNVPFDGEINLTTTQKKRFRVNGDNNTILELNVSDMGVITRLEKVYPELQKLSQDASIKRLEQSDADTEDDIIKISQALVKIDMTMRRLLDEIFDSNVSEVCAPHGTMMDPFNGEFRFEHIISEISKLYENNLNREFEKMSANMKKRTAKYTKGR